MATITKTPDNLPKKNIFFIGMGNKRRIQKNGPQNCAHRPDQPITCWKTCWGYWGYSL